MPKNTNLALQIPEHISVKLRGLCLLIEGIFGSAKIAIGHAYGVHVSNTKIIIQPSRRVRSSKSAIALGHCITAALKGVLLGHTVRLATAGVGYKFELESEILTVFLGTSLPKQIIVPSQISARLISSSEVIFSSASKFFATNFAQRVIHLARSNPYNAAGLTLHGHQKILKQGKRLSKSTQGARLDKKKSR